MAQRTTNIYRLVTLPAFYGAVQKLLGADAARTRFIEEMIRPEAGLRFLDCGCGPASLFPYLPDLDYTGIDLNPEHIAHAIEKYGDKGRFIVGDVTQNVVGLTAPFDLVMVSALLHHLGDKEARTLLSRLVSLTEPGGRIVTMDSIWLPRQNPIAWLFNKLDSGLNVRTAEGYLSLVEGLPVAVETTLYRDFFRIPYDHFCMTLRRL